MNLRHEALHWELGHVTWCFNGMTWHIDKWYSPLTSSYIHSSPGGWKLKTDFQGTKITSRITSLLQKLCTRSHVRSGSGPEEWPKQQRLDCFTLPETNSQFAPENGWMGMEYRRLFPFGMAFFFRCENVSFREGIWPMIISAFRVALRSDEKSPLIWTNQWHVARGGPVKD